MNHEKMWEELKTQIKNDLEYHKSGVMQSLSESINGEIKCEQFLRYMDEIERKNMNE